MGPPCNSVQIFFLKIYLFERQKREKEKRFARSLLFGPHQPVLGQAEARFQEFHPCPSPMWVAGSQAPGPPFPALSGASVGSRMGSRAAGTPTGTYISCWWHTCKLSWLWHGTSPEYYIYFLSVSLHKNCIWRRELVLFIFIPSCVNILWCTINTPNLLQPLPSLRLPPSGQGLGYCYN